MNEKKESRLRRARRARAKISELRVNRLTVYRSPRHIYAQIISPDNKILVTASSLGEKKTGNVDSAAEIGKKIAEKAKSAGITKVAFDRSGYRYHGRVKALAEAAREGGLEF
ncbi:MAG: 50S ribosomal protein L18 [Gammaproteobacteria bacterium]|nr:50S ribosomal protein L18 [Gammaproteobacteria bacterium]MAY02407.1 50S ribosomal protein L18 [Gammaproteobacteria bacterium]|tara:strand:- start:167 stop:502 length:336 start_codon:yes stop_codon:yes gene_type:complete